MIVVFFLVLHIHLKYVAYFLNFPFYVTGGEHLFFLNKKWEWDKLCFITMLESECLKNKQLHIYDSSAWLRPSLSALQHRGSGNCRAFGALCSDERQPQCLELAATSLPINLFNSPGKGSDWWTLHTHSLPANKAAHMPSQQGLTLIWGPMHLEIQL